MEQPDDAERVMAAARAHVLAAGPATEHERIMVAARASVVAAQALRLPVEDPDVGVAHDALRSLARLQEGYEKERRANREMRLAVLDFGRKTSVILWSGVALSIMCVAFGAFMYARQADLNKKTAAIAEQNHQLILQSKRLGVKNTEAIRVGCTVTKNAILQSGASSASRRPSTPAARAQGEINAILVGAIVRSLLSRGQQARLGELQRVVTRAGGLVSIPDCDQIARHPERVGELLEARKPRGR